LHPFIAILSLKETKKNITLYKQVYSDNIGNPTKTGYMATLIIYLFSFWAPLFWGLHDNHYSVTNIDYSPNTDSISLALKINIPDLDFALAHNNDSPLGHSCKENNPETDNLIIQYIASTFSIKINKGSLSKFKFIRKEISGDDTWVYLSIPACKKEMELEIMNALLFDIFTDQINLVIFSENGKEMGYKTTFYDRIIRLKVNSRVNEKT
jgi:hypothetical protein